MDCRLPAHSPECPSSRRFRPRSLYYPRPSRPARQSHRLRTSSSCRYVSADYTDMPFHAAPAAVDDWRSPARRSVRTSYDLPHRYAYHPHRSAQNLHIPHHQNGQNGRPSLHEMEVPDNSPFQPQQASPSKAAPAFLLPTASYDYNHTKAPDTLPARRQYPRRSDHRFFHCAVVLPICSLRFLLSADCSLQLKHGTCFT